MAGALHSRGRSADGIEVRLPRCHLYVTEGFESDMDLAFPLQEGEKLWIAHIKSLLAGTELRVGNVTVGEVKGSVINLKGI